MCGHTDLVASGHPHAMEGGDLMLEFLLPTFNFSMASDVIRLCVSSFLTPWGFEVALFMDTLGYMDHTISATITWILAEARNAKALHT
jgi:hypothetical protein